MSEEEEAKALETLRSTSPALSLLELVELHKEKVNEVSEMNIFVLVKHFTNIISISCQIF